MTVVSVIYDTLAFILGDVNTTSNLSSYYALSNSRIISSTVKPLGEEQLKQPVRIVLENNGTVGCTRIHAQRIISCTVMVKRSYTFHCSSIPATCTYISSHSRVRSNTIKQHRFPPVVTPQQEGTSLTGMLGRTVWN